MATAAPILAGEQTAARLLDLPLSEFRKLVAAGHLPPGRHIAPGVIRWDTDTLRSIGKGEAIDGGIDW